MAAYWQKRIQESNARNLKRTRKETFEKTRQMYQEQREDIFNLLLGVLAKIEEDSKDGRIYANDLYLTDKYVTLMREFKDRLHAMGVEQNDLLTKAMIETYLAAQEVVERNAPKSGPGYSFLNLAAIDPEQAIRQVWCSDGKEFSDRIWTSKSQMLRELEKALFDNIARGENAFSIAQGVAERLGVDEGHAYRLIRTETAHAAIRGQVDKYKELGFTHGVFRATDPCDDCGEHDGEEYPLDQIVSMIPRHPNCECSFDLKI